MDGTVSFFTLTHCCQKIPHFFLLLGYLHKGGDSLCALVFLLLHAALYLKMCPFAKHSLAKLPYCLQLKYLSLYLPGDFHSILGFLAGNLDCLSSEPVLFTVTSISIIFLCSV